MESCYSSAVRVKLSSETASGKRAKRRVVGRRGKGDSKERSALSRRDLRTQPGVLTPGMSQKKNPS
jgi:hypothetical protein